GLWRRGLTVVPRYGHPGGVRIPLAVGHPALPGELLLAVLTDDHEYMAEPSLRRRDRHWIERLAARGWVVRTVYSSAVFMDPQGEAERIATVVEDRGTAGTGGGRSQSTVALPDHVEEDGDPAAGAEGAAAPDAAAQRQNDPATTTSARGLAMVGEHDASAGATAGHEARGP